MNSWLKRFFLFDRNLLLHFFCRFLFISLFDLIITSRWCLFLMIWVGFERGFNTNRTSYEGVYLSPAGNDLPFLLPFSLSSISLPLAFFQHFESFFQLPKRVKHPFDRLQLTHGFLTFSKKAVLLPFNFALSTQLICLVNQHLVDNLHFSVFPKR